MTAVLVTWHDAHSGSESWTYIKDIDLSPCEVSSVGFLLTEEDGGKPNHVTIYQSRQDDAVDHILNIPKGMVVSIKVLMDLKINN